jgi:hypothetical protein
MIMLALGVSALLVNWLVQFPAAAEPVLSPILEIFGIVFTVLGVAVITEEHVSNYRLLRSRNNQQPKVIDHPRPERP